jgi:hypothetical protein
MGFGDAAQPVPEPVGPLRDVNACEDIADRELAERVRAYAQQLLNRERATGEQRPPVADGHGSQPTAPRPASREPG